MRSSGFHLSIVDPRFGCPECEHGHDGEDYRERLNGAKQGWVTVTCKNCGYKFGHTTDITCRPVAFRIDTNRPS